MGPIFLREAVSVSDRLRTSTESEPASIAGPIQDYHSNHHVSWNEGFVAEKCLAQNVRVCEQWFDYRKEVTSICNSLHDLALICSLQSNRLEDLGYCIGIGI